MVWPCHIDYWRAGGEHLPYVVYGASPLPLDRKEGLVRGSSFGFRGSQEKKQKQQQKIPSGSDEGRPAEAVEHGHARAVVIPILRLRSAWHYLTQD